MINRISKEKKEAFNLVIKEYREKVEETNKKAKGLEREAMLNKDMAAFYRRVAAANVYLNTIGLYCEMNSKSVEIMNIKNDAYLNNARKNIYNAIKLLESIVGSEIDTPLTDNDEVLSKMDYLTPKRIKNILKKVEYCIALNEFEAGENSKWKWNFVELYGKYAALCKNMINFKQLAPKANNPMEEFYEDITELFRIVKTTVDTAAKKFRTKYELSTMDVSDMNKAINFMELLVKIHVILNEPNFAQEAKKGIEKWKEKLEQDLKKKEEEKKASTQKQLKKRRR